MSVAVHVCGIADPARPVEFEELARSGALVANEVVAVIGKVDGSGNGNDAARALAASRIRDILARHGMANEDIHEVPVVLSSGCAGLISPNLTVFTRSTAGRDAGVQAFDTGLRVGCARSVVIEPGAIGRMGQVDAVAEATRRALGETGGMHEVGCVLVKTPSLRPEHVRRFGAALRSGSTSESMALANDASALGVAVGLGEVDGSRITDEGIRRDWENYSEVAIVSAGPEIERAEVVVLGNGGPSGGRQRIGRDLIRDPLDRDGVTRAIAAARGPLLQAAASGYEDVVQVFAKLILPVDDSVRGYPTSFFQEPSPAATAKAVGAALIGSLVGRTNVFVSGGERGSHQGPLGAGPVAVIVRRVP